MESLTRGRVLCVIGLAAMLAPSDNSALEFKRVAACSGIILRLRGDFRQGDYARFIKHFQMTEPVFGLDIISNGGDLDEGIKMARFTRQRELNIFVGGECSSVCSFLFFAGNKRFVSYSAMLGVHAVSCGNRTDPEATRRIAHLSARMGVPRSAIIKLVQTPPARITYLTATDLLTTVAESASAAMGQCQPPLVVTTLHPLEAMTANPE